MEYFEGAGYNFEGAKQRIFLLEKERLEF